LFAEESRYAEARTSTFAVAAAACFGGFIATSLHHMKSNVGIRADTISVIPMSQLVNRCVTPLIDISATTRIQEKLKQRQVGMTPIRHPQSGRADGRHLV
jgi:hypothetical protein